MDDRATPTLTRRLMIEARAENLFDERVVAGTSGAGLVDLGTLRTFWIGLRLRRLTGGAQPPDHVPHQAGQVT